MTSSKKVVGFGIDLGKNVFHLIGVNDVENVLLNKKLRRGRLSAYGSILGPCLIGVETCGGSNYGAREINKLGHKVQLMSPRYVKCNMNNYNDAEEICEAVSRPNRTTGRKRNLRLR